MDPTTRQFCHDRNQIMQLLKQNLTQAQARMKFYADKQRMERSFSVGDLVYLRIKPYKQVSLQQLKYCKLSPKYFGPYKVLEKIGTMAYRLELPPNAKIHNVFHVSVLKKKLVINVSFHLYYLHWMVMGIS